MKTPWEKIFESDHAALSEAEDEQALQELAGAVTRVENLQESSQHQRILKLIAGKLRDEEESSSNL